MMPLKVEKAAAVVVVFAARGSRSLGPKVLRCIQMQGEPSWLAGLI